MASSGIVDASDVQRENVSSSAPSDLSPRNVGALLSVAKDPPSQPGAVLGGAFRLRRQDDTVEAWTQDTSPRSVSTKTTRLLA